ncbi:response regulator [Candidatus Pacearchaeota archaeon]|nr:response regulator [Candidatus Pacearchaeota archaeon]
MMKKKRGLSVKEMKMGERKSKIKILIVDDEADVLTTMKNIVEREGYEATAEQDSRKAVILAKTINYDLVILDIMMPGLNGEETAELMKKDAKGSPKMLFCTIVPKNEIEKLFLVDGFIQKPLDYKKFTDEIKRVLGERK